MRNLWIYNRVNQLIKTYQTRDPEELIKRLNIHIQYIDATKSLLGMYKIILKNRFIFLPTNVGTLRRTVLAHELGHDQLHRKECLSGTSFHESRIFNPSNQYELEANVFAAHLLIPDEEVLKMIRFAKSDQELSNALEVDINLLNLKVSEMAKMNLLDLEKSKIEAPDCAFLKQYKPLNDEWSDF